MRGNRKKDTRPEVLLRAAMHRAGLRYRTYVAIEGGGLRARADVVFPKRRLAVFVDGCFWHGCPEHATKPRTNVDYWEAKLRGNADRDRRVDQALTASGWSVIRIWEHDVDRDLEACVERVAKAIEQDSA
ncbi:MAG TPA: very short patch repair endonuclease [Candidatus Limnocylindrales bacterium]|nr:very short patch repair endonuclease [Candidatus Limnocylindrales bacterium]